MNGTSVDPRAWRARATRVLWPAGAAVVMISLWYGAIRLFDIPRYLLPTPHAVVRAGIDDWDYLSHGIRLTFTSALIGFLLACAIGVAAATILSQSKVLEKSLYPYAIVLQTIPIVAIAPMIVVWMGTGRQTIAAIAFIIAFFPIISNTTLGLTSTDHNLVNLLELYSASRWQMLVKLRIPFAIPFVVGGMRISAGLSVIGAIVGEFVAGMGGRDGGLGYQIAESATMVRTTYLFAAAFAACGMGLLVFFAINSFSYFLLRNWHESSVRREN
jgi:NitT/TauT family transport system permease protein